MSLFVLLLIVLVISGVIFFGYAFAYRMPSMRPNRIHDDPHRKLVGPKFHRRVFANMALSSSLVFASSYLFYDALFEESGSSWAAAALDVVLILLVYDFFYYWMHRVAFHQWPMLRRIHAVHHAVRNPNAFDALYLHPVETFVGLALLMICTWALGPVSVGTFAVAFFVYSALNIVVHSGLDLRCFGLRTLSFLARKHDTHHTSMKGGNYASITPIWDILFGTAE